MDEVCDLEELRIEANIFFENNRKNIVKNFEKESKTISINLEELAGHSPELAINLVNSPEKILQLLEIELRKLEWAPLNIRICINTSSNLIESLTFNEIRSRHLNKLVSIKGIIKKTGSLYIKSSFIIFECFCCGNLIKKKQIGNKKNIPIMCKCGSSKLKEINYERDDFMKISIADTNEEIRDIEINGCFVNNAYVYNSLRKNSKLKIICFAKESLSRKFKFELIPLGIEIVKENYNINKIDNTLDKLNTNTILDLIRELEKTYGKSIPIFKLEDKLGNNIEGKKLEKILEFLVDSGEIFSCKKGQIRTCL